MMMYEPVFGNELEKSSNKKTRILNLKRNKQKNKEKIERQVIFTKITRKGVIVTLVLLLLF